MSAFLPSSAPPSSWQLATDARLLLRFWDAECVLFHGASSDTHRLPDIVGRMLQQLEAGPATVAELSRAIDLHEDDVLAALQELGRLGVLEAAACG